MKNFRKAQMNYDNMEHPHYYEDDPRTKCECCDAWPYDCDLIEVWSDESDPEDRCKMKVCEECSNDFEIVE